MKSLRTILMIAALAALLVSCSGKDEGAAGGPAEPSTLTIASTADAKRLMPMLATDTATSGISGRIFNGLTKYDKDINIAPELAESWDVSPGGLVITFHLRKDVRWQDGKPFTSADVLFTYNTLRDPKVATPYSDSLGPLDKVEAPDDYTVKVTYKEPFAPALEAWGMGIIPKHLLEGQDINTAEFNRHPVGTGPFRFSEWVTGERITLVANDDYFLGRPKTDRIVTRVIPETSTQFLELKAGGIDFMGLTPVQYERQTGGEEFTRKFYKLRYPDFVYTYMGYNLRDERFKDVRVRKALTYAIDTDSIIDGVLMGLGSPCTGPFPPKSWAYNADVKSYPHDVEKA
ncbi:MAG TPA: ABC transporter substrate-binding protein, partial [Nitrospirota bacterium]